jgi:hypothetical protein
MVDPNYTVVAKFPKKYLPKMTPKASFRGAERRGVLRSFRSLPPAQEILCFAQDGREEKKRAANRPLGFLKRVS